MSIVKVTLAEAASGDDDHVRYLERGSETSHAWAIAALLKSPNADQCDINNQEVATSL